MTTDQEQERTEQATPKRRQEARQKGQVAKSQDIVAALSLFGMLLFFIAAFEQQAEYATGLLSESLSQKFILQTDVEAFSANLTSYIWQCLGKLSLLFLVVVGSTLAANFLQTGFLFLPDKLFPQTSRVNPFLNLSKIFSLDSLGHIFFGCLKLLLFIAAAAFALKRDLETTLSLPNGEPTLTVVFICRYLKRLAFLFCATMLAIGIADYVFKRIALERKLRMTQQELRDEIKEEGGNPQIKGKRNAMRRSALESVSATTAAQPTSPVSRYRNKEKQTEERQTSHKGSTTDAR